MKRGLFVCGCVALSCITGLAPAQPRPAPLPQLPGQDDGAVAQGGSPGAFPAAEAPTPQQLYERLRRGVVAIERNGVPVAIGTVLAGDGRILTALSGLGGSEGADVRYADGTAVHAKLGRSDKDQDLALLVPQSGKWTDGLTASEADPMGVDLRALLPVRGARLGPAGAGIKGRADARTRGGEPLAQMLDVDLKGPPVAGAPLLDAAGRVVAVLVRACKGGSQTEAASGVGAWPVGDPPPPKCSPVIVGAPVSAIRTFLSRIPAAAPAPWLGIRGEAENAGDVRGVRIVAVAPASPAEKAGLKPNADIIVAVDGQPIDSPDKLSEAIAKHAAGDSVKLLVFGVDKFRELMVTLRPSP